MTALMAKELSRSFGEEVAVDDIDLEIHPGEIHAIVGLNGAGKTTLMRLMLGMLRPGTGQATKLVNQTLVLTNYCVLAEALRLVAHVGPTSHFIEGVGCPPGLPGGRLCRENRGEVIPGIDPVPTGVTRFRQVATLP